MTGHRPPLPGAVAPLAPLRHVVVGLLLVALDLNLGRFDVLADPVGYLVVALALTRVVPLHRAFGWARGAAAVGVLTSAAGMLLRTVDPGTGAVVEHPVISVVDTVLDAVVVVALCTALLALCSSSRVLGPARILRWALPAVAVVAGLLGVVTVLGARGAERWSPGMTEAAGGLLGLAVIVLVATGIVLGIWFLVVLWRASREPVMTGVPRAAMIPG